MIPAETGIQAAVVRTMNLEEKKMRKFYLCLFIFLLVIPHGCAPTIRLFPDAADPLKEFTISGKGEKKILVVPVRGIISDQQKGKIFEKPTMVQEIVSQLRMAEKDKQIKAVVLKINSPGGSATASDIIYHEIMRYKEKSGVKVVAAMMDLAASGGYYVALPADRILAHPTTITGSIGVIMLLPKIDGLMEKLGVTVDVQKSGKNKDMGSPFRQPTAEERQILQHVTDELGRRFAGLVERHRKMNKERLAQVTTAKIFIASEAQAVGLIDEIGYLNDALSSARKLAGLSDNARVVVYRRKQYANDNIYNTSTTQSAKMDFSMIQLDLPGGFASLETGFYYLWLPGASSN